MKLYRDMTDEEKAKADAKLTKKLKNIKVAANWAMLEYDAMPKELRDTYKYAVRGL